MRLGIKPIVDSFVDCDSSPNLWMTLICVNRARLRTDSQIVRMVRSRRCPLLSMNVEDVEEDVVGAVVVVGGEEATTMKTGADVGRNQMLLLLVLPRPRSKKPSLILSKRFDQL